MRALVRACSLCALLATLPASAQIASAPDEPIVPPGIPPDERVDVTGDGIADLVITGIVDRTPDPTQGLDGWYRRGVRTLPGTSVLMRSTHNNAGLYFLPDSARIDTAALAKGFHFEQLQWTASDELEEFKLLEQPFGPGLDPGAHGWYGTGDLYEGRTMILRSTVTGSTRIATFSLWFNLPAGRIGVTKGEVVTVPWAFGKEVDTSPPKPTGDDPFGFGHEVEPEVMIPPGLPPDEAVDLDQDEVPDVIITAHEEPWHGEGHSGYYVRGISPVPGAAFLKQRQPNGPWTYFQLNDADTLEPEQLAAGLQKGSLFWDTPADAGVFCAVLWHPFGRMNVSDEWSYVSADVPASIVYRTSSRGRPVIGLFEIRGSVPGGSLSVAPQNFVPEGQVLDVR